MNIDRWLEEAIDKVKNSDTNELIANLENHGLIKELDPEIAQITSENLWELYEGDDNDNS